MAATLLNCSICPRQPTFSDTSHLLTHVSSKGHLSHLHKLQVRSHQEIHAGHQLAAYTQWYQEYELSRLLSERMVQKESKKATKRRRTTASPKKIKDEGTTIATIVASDDQHLAVDPRLQQTPSTRPARRSKVISGSILLPDADSDFDSSPIKQHAKRKARRSLPSWIKRSPSEANFDILGPDRPAEVDPEILNTPDNSKLKGVLWPGMHLFDAATAEMRRRRNQKKDGSALMQMERTSKSVQPTEVIYSEGWTSTKQRPITGMVEDSSPLKGESPLPKKPVRRKRPALAEVSVNLPRNIRKPVKLEHPQGTHFHRGLDYLANRSSPPLPSSSSGTSEAARSRFSPTEDETMEFKLTVGDLVNRKKGGNFTIFQDKENIDSTQLLSAMAGQRERAYPHFASRQTQSYLPQAKPQIPFTTPSWLQPQYQQVQSYQNMYVHQGFGSPAYYGPQQIGPGKENVEPWFVRTGQVEQHPNPLGWNHNPTLVQNPYQAYNNFGHDVQNGFSGLPSQDDVFGYSANPLSAAYQTLQDHPESPFKTSETADLPAKPLEAKKGSMSPDGTISERSEHDYDQSVFTITE